MVRLREIPRTACFAWSPGAAPPLIATGTRAGAVDADFSNETQLEIWDLALDTPEQGVELQPLSSISTDSRFHDIAWSEPSEDHPRGIIAGALESGSLDLWDAEKLWTNPSEAHISRTSKHSGAIKALQFNPFRPELLATAGARGELFITDLNNASNPTRLGTSAARADDFECLDWNKKVPHILATGSSGGFVTVWDLKAKKESLTLNNMGRKAVSAIAWDPEVATRLITAIPHDQDPLILVWDLRNSNAPERTLRAHDQGVLSLSWCPQDSELLLSCGKDNRTICWNPRTGDVLGEFPVVTNWTFQTRWNPHNPSLLATASFDGKIGVQTIQNTRASKTTSAAAAPALDGEDFFSKAQTQPQGATFSLAKAPKWLERPVGVSFGFGGRIVKFGPTESGSRQSKISLSTFAVDTAIGAATEKFEEALNKGDLASICREKIAGAKTDEEKADWTVMETLLSGNTRRKLVEYLGFSDTPSDTRDKADGGQEEGSRTNGVTSAKDDASFFEDGGAGDNFLADLAATKGAKTNNPFQIYTGTETEADKDITRALMLGSFEKALEICLKENRLSDAFMIAICGGQKCIDKAQAAYFKRKADGPNYLRLLASVVGKNLWDVVYNADLANWKEIMATLCTFADETEFPDLCEALGDRLEESIQDGADASDVRKNASFCYLAGSKLEKVVGNWVQELVENEDADLSQAEGGSSFSIHAKSLQDFIEKVTVFRRVTRFQDVDLQKTEEWKLAPLYAKYTEYADIIASHGQLQVAEKYLDLLPAKYPAAEVARNRVKQATRKAAPQAAQRQTAAAANTTTQRSQRVVPAYQPTQPQTVPLPTPSKPRTVSQYNPPNAPAPVQQMPQQTYTPAATSGYAPAGYQQPQHFPQANPGGIPTPQPYGLGYQPPQQQPLPPPPRGFTASPSIPPPPKASNVSQWNDVPDFGPKAPTSRRGTPSLGAGAITSPFPNQQQSPVGPPPPMGPPQFAAQQRATPPPPPRGPPQGPPRMMSPSTAPGSQYLQPERPSSSAANTYAPSQPVQPFAGGPPQHMIPRGTSPYNPPPSAAPPSNRYAPSPSPQMSSQPSKAPPPRQNIPPPNPYAPQQRTSSIGSTAAIPSPAPPSQPPQGPPQGYARPPPLQTQAPPAGPPRAGPPPGGPPPAAAPESRPSTAQSQRAVPAAAKYPPGDRSHIPSASQPIFEILNKDMQRVKSRAPQNFMPQVLDTEKRLNILFDHLNNEDLLKPDTISEMNELAQHLQARNYDQAQALFTDLMTNKTDEGSNWMVGVKRLIQMSRATPA
ncbi:protein transport protein S31 [Coniosporium apollinis]|uniref:Protein transport protein SEC31 n=1 Tax=Coniosporium apollinis TaxID=61459 RepID=A0ABQ9NT37_9PEZI|nr:protein transport protein S31 [Coniosporium apollinis]